MDKKVLLIADDDEMNRIIIRKFLQKSFEILEAQDGEEALELLRSHHVDALLLDIIMPKLDGLEVLKILREEMKNNQIGVLVATSTKEKTEREALSLGADDVVSKPYDPVVIKKRMQNIIVLKEIQQKNEWIIQENTGALMQQERAELKNQMIKSVEKIQSLVAIIETSIHNPALLERVVVDLKRETDTINGMLTD